MMKLPSIWAGTAPFLFPFYRCRLATVRQVYSTRFFEKYKVRLHHKTVEMTT
jgi:hypothetical protein